MEFLSEYGLFLAKAITIVVALAAIIGLLVSAGHRGKGTEKGHIEVTRLNDSYEEMQRALKEAVLDEHALKAEHKAEKKREKEKAAAQKKAAKSVKDGTSAGSVDAKKRLYVLNFHGDMKASETVNLREEISAVLSLARPTDEVLVRLESGGGLVHSYGLASSQLARVTQKGIPLTVCVDKVAASGGYMMACVADKVLAAPFAIIGSIGVLAQLPNFHRLLKKHDIDFEMITAGEHKRTLTLFGENTDEDREKFVEDIEDTHQLFKEFVTQHRPAVNIAEVATGEVWFGRRAVDVSLVDDLQTSDEYITAQLEATDIYEVSYQHKKSLPEKLGLAAQESTDRLLLSWWGRLQSARWFS